MTRKLLQSAGRKTSSLQNSCSCRLQVIHRTLLIHPSVCNKMLQDSKFCLLLQPTHVRGLPFVPIQSRLRLYNGPLPAGGEGRKNSNSKAVQEASDSQFINEHEKKIYLLPEPLLLLRNCRSFSYNFICVPSKHMAFDLAA